MSHGLIRAVCLFVPMLATALVWAWRRPNSREVAGALLAVCWNLPSLLLLHVIANGGWWHYDAQGGMLLEMPVDLYLGWAIAWGAFGFLAFSRLSLPVLCVLMFAIDLLYMPRLRPVLVLGPQWWIGEFVGIAICLVPAQLLARWTRDDARLPARAALQAFCFAGFLLGVIPAAVLDSTRGSWHAPHVLWLQALVLPAVLGLSAVQEFVSRGQGTPVPLDPPKRLVTSGVYSYVRNPMQIAGCLLLLSWGLALGSILTCLCALMAVVYSAGFAARDESEDLLSRFGPAWRNYASAVRPWWPRWRPLRSSSARLYIAASCPVCSQLGSWIRRRSPVELQLAAAEEHPRRILFRMTYDPLDGTVEDDGVAALGRALEHIHLGWAFAGWTIRLPLVKQLIQIAADAAGAAPQPAPRRSIVTPLNGS